MLDRLYLAAGGGAVPLAAVATLALEPAPSTLRRFDAGPSAIVTAYTVSGANTDRITEVASAVAGSGASAVTLINTMLGMQIDPVTRRPSLGNGGGGLSGPPIHAIAVPSTKKAELRPLKAHSARRVGDAPAPALWNTTLPEKGPLSHGPKGLEPLD